MSFLLWQRGGDMRIASTRLVLRAAEVPLLQHAHVLRDTLERRRDEQVLMITEAAAEARAQGHAQGLAEGRREAAGQMADALLRLAAESAGERERLRNDTGALALQVVRKLLGAFADDAVLVALAATASAELLPGPSAALVVHPEQADAVRARLAQAQAAGGPQFELRIDATCAEDACRLETEHGSVDVALESQLARLAAAWGVE
jgi:flagellar biosynthesis/type III secretory pathway protein FliH